MSGGSHSEAVLRMLFRNHLAIFTHQGGTLKGIPSGFKVGYCCVELSFTKLSSGAKVKKWTDEV